MRRDNCAVVGAGHGASGLRNSRAAVPNVPAHGTSLSPKIILQLQTIAGLSRIRSPQGLPDPGLFGAISRLEEMLPRSATTRRAQGRGRIAYTAMVTSHSLKLARQWPALQNRIEREMRLDRQYMRARDAVDRWPEPSLSDGAVPVQRQGTNRIGTAVVRKTTSLPFNRMRPGDIMIWDDRSGPPMVRIALSMFAQKCTHSALYLGDTVSRKNGVEHWSLELQNPILGVRRSLIAEMGRVRACMSRSAM